jgi:hypothetical protein
MEVAEVEAVLDVAESTATSTSATLLHRCQLELLTFDDEQLMTQ